ncbi:hypothetical protein PIB30_066630 [Stylosanthes scabra]|uniref:Uncharacterized protein n=1 Tax=Stylosanthes scabra TaxID=79078 RepID=A0ABU6WN25_9FABA|nr:hypothetical protein [Stylosanthes scabra]
MASESDPDEIVSLGEETPKEKKEDEVKGERVIMVKNKKIDREVCENAHVQHPLEENGTNGS